MQVDGKLTDVNKRLPEDLFFERIVELAVDGPMPQGEMEPVPWHLPS